MGSRRRAPTERSPVSLKLTQRQRNDLLRGLVQTPAAPAVNSFFPNATQPRDHLRARLPSPIVRLAVSRAPVGRSGIWRRASEGTWPALVISSESGLVLTSMGCSRRSTCSGRARAPMSELRAALFSAPPPHALCHVPLQGADEHRSTLDLLDDIGRSRVHASRQRCAVTIRNEKLPSPPDIARAIMDSNDGRIRVDDRLNSLPETFVPGCELEDCVGLLGPVVVVTH